MSQNNNPCFEEENEPFHYLANNNKHHYQDNILLWTQILYILAIIIWFLLIYVLDLIPPTWVGWFILLIPVIAFGLSYHFTRYQTTETENQIFQGNFLAFASIIALLVINWLKEGNKCKIYRIVLTALILLLLSLTDVWMRCKYVIILKHFRVICQSLALTLLIYAIYIHYAENICVKS